MQAARHAQALRRGAGACGHHRVEDHAARVALVELRGGRGDGRAEVLAADARHGEAFALARQYPARRPTS